MTLDKNKYKELFCSEAEEQLATLSQSLLELEGDPSHSEQYQNLMRCAHTVKGAAATMGYVVMAELAHAMEDVFHSAERGVLLIDPKVITLLLTATDRLTLSLSEIRKNGIELPTDAIINHLRAILTDSPIETNSLKNSSAPESITSMHIATPDTIRVSTEKLDTLMGLFEEMLMLRLKIDAMMEPATKFVNTLQDKALKQRLFFITELDSTFAEFSRLLSENQDALLSIRLVPLEQIFGQFPRMVRDLALREDKAIEFNVRGGDIALDRRVIEGLGGALAHLLRNAVDHGIQSKGAITLSSIRHKSRVLIIVEDTGAGINYERVKEVALSRGIATSEQLAKMQNNQIAELLFHQNMSTSEKVTDISGRGVGLSAVRWFAEDVGGSIDVISPIPEKSFGTRFTLDLPISLATVHVLTLQAQGYTFALPFDHVIKTIQYQANMITGEVHQETLLVDGKFLPILHLEKLLQLTYAGYRQNGKAVETRNGIVLQAGSTPFILEVDRCTGQQELLVKSLPPILRTNKSFSGSALLPDGRTILLLDGHGLLTLALSDILNKTNQ